MGFVQDFCPIRKKTCVLQSLAHGDIGLVSLPLELCRGSFILQELNVRSSRLEMICEAPFPLLRLLLSDK